MTHTRVYGRTESRYSVHENIYPVAVPVRLWRKDEHAHNANCPMYFLPFAKLLRLAASSALVYQPMARGPPIYDTSGPVRQ